MCRVRSKRSARPPSPPPVKEMGLVALESSPLKIRVLTNVQRQMDGFSAYARLRRVQTLYGGSRRHLAESYSCMHYRFHRGGAQQTGRKMTPDVARHMLHVLISTTYVS